MQNRPTPSLLLFFTPRLFLFTTLIVAGLCGFIAPAHAVTLAPGDLVKLPDDGNLNTTADSAVYFHGSDSKRYVFPNSQTYFTWYSDFSKVKIIDATQMASLPIGGNISYRPGTRLVKITSDPNVYAVEPGGTLRWVTSEAVAKGLYGDLWNKRVDDIPDAFFFNYHIGESLTAPVYPTGTIVKRTTDNAYFRIENRNKRKIASAEVKATLGVQETFVISTAADLSDYPDASDIVAAEPAITDTAQKNLTSIPSQPTFSLRLPATNFIAVGGDATLLEVRMASVKAFTVKKLTAKIDATTNNPASASVDDDKGGMVYQNNAQPNLKLIRFIDGSGVEVFGRKDVALDVVQDQSQTFVFSGTYNVPAGEEKVLYLRTQLNTLLPSGEGYKVTLPIAGIEVVDSGTGAALAFQPQADIVGPNLASLNASLEVSASTLPGSKTYVRGAKNAEISGLAFKATTVAPNVINSVTFQGYVDEEGSAGFLPGTDTDNGSPRLVNELVPQVSLYTSAGTKVAGPVVVGADGRATFSGLSYLIQAGQTANLVVRGDISAAVDIEQQPDRLAFDIVDAAQDMAVVDEKGGKVPAVGKMPGGGVTPGAYMTVKKNGTATFTWTGSTGAVIAGQETLLGTLGIDVKIDSYALKTLSFKASGSHSSLGDLRLEYPTATGTASVASTFLGDNAVFQNLPIILPVDKKTDIKLYGKLFTKDNGAVYGQQIKTKFDTSGSLVFTSQSSGETYDETKLSGDFTVPANTESAGVVRFGMITLSRSADSPGGSIFRENTSEVLRFLVKTEAENGARIKKITFKLTPADSGSMGADNDSLERWAKVNGDFNDDDGVVNLYQVLPNGNRILMGEDTLSRIMYSVVQGGAKNSSPSAITSAVNDYGLIEYVFNEGSELTFAAGATQLFSFGVDTTLFNSANDYGLTVDLLGGADFEWTDIMSGTYTALYGADAVGLPVGNGVTVKK